MATGALGRQRLRVAIGPCRTSFGSWQWLGEDLAQSLAEFHDIEVFAERPGPSDVVLWIKFLPELAVLQELAQKSRHLFCPVDGYGSAAEIDRDAERLLLIDGVVVHAPRLQPYFQSYTRTTCVDHHLKYAIPTRNCDVPEGPILWVGVRSNLPAFVNYVNRQGLPAPLVLLTNPENSEDLTHPERWGFRPGLDVHAEEWSPAVQAHWLTRCRAAIDIKGTDFRARHKPAAKALDFLASGVPLAMNSESSSVEYVRSLGFQIADPQAPERWLSSDYAAETREFGARITPSLSLSQLTRQWLSIIEDVVTVAEPASAQQLRIDISSDEGCVSVSKKRPRVAIVSLLFNWPSTGGGTVHTGETARFLSQAGYDVRHFVIQYAGWKIGQVHEPVDWPMECLEFSDSEWHMASIRARVREQVRRFAPDSVIITDSWSFKPRLAEALQEFRYYLRLAAQETLCPLNNVRLLWSEAAGFQACPRSQMSTPHACQQCVQQNGRLSGDLHRAERELAGFASADYQDCLRQSYARAAGILVVNPLIAEQVKPFARHVQVVPSGFDPERFAVSSPPASAVDGRLRLLFAGLIHEPMKGFAVLQAACRQVWEQRQDFVLQATADPPGMVNEFTEFVGWHSQSSLPALMCAADVIVCPTVAEEALGRTAVEAMAAARPVVASRIGGLPFTVLEEATGLLCEPANAEDLARQLLRLLGDRSLRERLGTQGRRRFEETYAWPVIIRQHYDSLLRVASPSLTTGGTL